MTFIVDCGGPDVLRAGLVAIAELLEAGAVSNSDLAALRRLVGADRGVTQEEAEALFVLERRAAQKCSGWTAFFVEAITDYVVWQSRPTGVVSETQAEWLIGQADQAATIGALAALVNVMAEAHRVPLWLLSAVRGRAAQEWSGSEAALAASEVIADVA